MNDHRQAAAVVARAVEALNAALAAADRAGLVVNLVVLDNADRPMVRRVVTRCLLPVEADQ